MNGSARPRRLSAQQARLLVRMQEQPVLIQSYTVETSEAWDDRTYARTFYTLVAAGRPRGRLLHPGTFRSLLDGDYIQEAERRMDEHGTLFVTYTLTAKGRAWRSPRP